MELSKFKFIGTYSYNFVSCNENINIVLHDLLNTEDAHCNNIDCITLDCMIDDVHFIFKCVDIIDQLNLLEKFNLLKSERID